MLLRTTAIGMALYFATWAGLAAESNPPVATDPRLQERVEPSEDTARPDWPNPDAEEPAVGVDDDPTPFGPGTNPPDPD